jgi:hypothetical protein
MEKIQGQETGSGDSRLRSRAERNLSSLVTTIEFTLISVMAGVVLAPLADNAKDLLHGLRYEYWPYILFGLLYVLFMWSGVVSHSFTFVGWPLELGHNLFYIVWALVLAVQMAYMQDPMAWFAANIVQYLVVGSIGYYDLRILQRRAKTSEGAAKALFEMAGIRQVRLIRMFPLAAGSAALSLALMALAPGLFLDQHAHWLLGCFQVLVACGGLLHNIRSLNAWQEPIVEKAMKELAEEE